MLEIELKIISPTTTFYPIDSNQEEDQTLNNTIAFIRASTGDRIQYFKSSEKITLFHYWHQVLFMMRGPTEKEYRMRYQIQIIRDILLFLFGPQFENVMTMNISSTNMNYFSRYASLVLKLIQTDIKSNIEVVNHDFNFNCYSKILQDKFSSVPIDLYFLECLIFKNNKLFSRISKPGSPLLDYSDVFILSLYIQIEHDDFNTNEDIDNFNYKYITNTNESPVKKRIGFFRVNGIPQKCTLVSTKLGGNSQYTAVFVSQKSINDSQKEVIINILGLMAIAINDMSSIPYPPQNLHHEMVYFMAVNRNNGLSWEQTTAENQESKNILNLLLNSMLENAISTLYKGKTVIIWSDELFRFAYQICFVDSNNEILIPKNQMFIDITTDESDLNYSEFASDLFPKTKNVQVYEIYSIFLKAIEPSKIMQINQSTLLAGAKSQSIAKATGKLAKSNSDYYIKSAVPIPTRNSKRIGSYNLINQSTMPISKRSSTPKLIHNRKMFPARVPFYSRQSDDGESK